MKHLAIPDTQVSPGYRLDHFGWIGKYAAEKQPDTIIHLGDWLDLASLSEYDRVTKPGLFHTRKLVQDQDAFNRSLDLLMEPILKAKGYTPRLVYLEGNHEQRYWRLTLSDPRLEGAVAVPWERAKQAGWSVRPFLVPITIDGILYAHYFCRGPNGTVVNSKHGAPSAKAQVTREMRSCTAGHKQGLDVHIQPTSMGMARGIIAGSCYQNDFEYLSPQGTVYWRGVLMKHEVKAGNYNLMEVSLDYLKRRFA